MMHLTNSSSWSFPLTLLFGITLLVGLATRFWLASKQIRHVAKHRDEVPTPYKNIIDLNAHQKAANYTISKTNLGMIEIGLGGVILLAWTLLGGLSALNQVLIQSLGDGFIQQLSLIVSFIIIGGLIDLPMSYYQTFGLENKFGFNNTTVKLWFQDLGKGILIGSLIGLPVAAFVIWMMTSLGTTWWLWTWGFWLGFNLLLLFIYPNFIAPIFNQFKPLDDPTLTERVTGLMQRCGFSAKGFFVMDGSKRSAHANAYFTGFGASKRVVFYDTLLEKLTHEEVEAVLAHELGHFKYKHVQKRLFLMFALSFIGLAFLGWLSQQVWFYTGLGVIPNLQGGNQALALLLFLIATPVFTFFITPFASRSSRNHEFQADAFAVSQSSGGDLCSALLKLYNDNASTLTPDPTYANFYYSHPPATERLERMSAPI